MQSGWKTSEVAGATSGSTRLPDVAGRKGFSLLELLIAVAVIVVIAAIAVPAYRGYTAAARDSVLVNQMRSMSAFQEDAKLRTGTYGGGTHDAAADVRSLTESIGWAPSSDDGTIYVVVADGATSWTATATDATGRQLCRAFPSGEPCPVP